MSISCRDRATLPPLERDLETFHHRTAAQTPARPTFPAMNPTLLMDLDRVHLPLLGEGQERLLCLMPRTVRRPDSAVHILLACYNPSPSLRPGQVV